MLDSHLFLWALVLSVLRVTHSACVDVSPLIHDFRIGGKHGEKHPHLLIQGAALTVPILNNFIDLLDPGYAVQNITYDMLPSYFESTKYEEEDKEFSDILDRHHSDKAYHNYHPVYRKLIQDLGGREKQLRTLEIGMGTNNPNALSTMGSNGFPGASLRAFEEYLPNSEIYGADIDRDILGASHKGRVQTTYVDGYNNRTLEALYHTFGSKPFDLIIDDAAHAVIPELNTLLLGLQHVNVPGYIVLEDIRVENFAFYRVIDWMLHQRDFGKNRTLSTKFVMNRPLILSQRKGLYGPIMYIVGIHSDGH